MGYSCSAIDNIVLKHIVATIQVARGSAGNSSNSWGHNQNDPEGFFEIGRENHDGSITGTVWASVGNGRCRKAGGFKISDGKVVRFPGTTASQRKQAELLAQAEWETQKNYLIGSGGGW
jgi:hypothetical protein